MKDGFYIVEYSSVEGMGAAVLAIRGGEIVGADGGGGLYRGTAVLNPGTGQYDVMVAVRMSPGAMTVFGMQAPPGGLTINATTALDVLDSQAVTINTDHGPLAARIRLALEL